MNLTGLLGQLAAELVVCAWLFKLKPQRSVKARQVADLCSFALRVA